MENQAEIRLQIEDKIKNFKEAEDIYNFFKYLNYPEDWVMSKSYKRDKSSFSFKSEDLNKINEIYMIANIEDNLPIFLLEVDTTNKTFIRSISSIFDKEFLNFLLIFTIKYNEIIFVFPEKERIEAGKFRLKITKLIVNKDELHYTDIDILSKLYNEEEKTNWLKILEKWKKAFDVERVTELFFEDYKKIFFLIRDNLIENKISRKEAHEFTLQFLNRLMFIYFISKKKWLVHSKFISWLWDFYKKMGKYNSNEFYENWLKQIFIKAFNNHPEKVVNLPDEIIEVLANFPYLNGSLFRENELDNLNIQINDDLFQHTFHFFEKYNFTIKEDMPLDSEVAVDPQMIGFIYESLANVAEEIYDRNDMGIFYTPRVEVDFMCRRSLVEYLSKHILEIPKEDFYHFIFDFFEEKNKIGKWQNDINFWFKIEEILTELSIIDPACGSGAFLVGMLNVLVDLFKIVYKFTNRTIDDFNLKKRIIQKSIYGVDVMPWAIHAAELRLWLQLIIETEFRMEKLKEKPLLPNLNINLRIGDSLVQELGGENLNLRSEIKDSVIKNKLNYLKNEKEKYFDNSDTALFPSLDSIIKEEIRIFGEIINYKIDKLNLDISKLENSNKNAKSQKTLTGDFIINEEIIKQNNMKIEINKNEIFKLKKINDYLKIPEKKPFIWDIDFSEIFGEKNGFDIVIGNPPYVRQELISPPNKLKEEVTLQDRRDYKEKLINSVINLYNNAIKKINRQSDYYVYFYFQGLGLLNNKGTFCFITSNSWLDVVYGKELQEFLSRYVPIIAIYDNPKRSFSHADINTIIALFGAPRIIQEQKTLENYNSTVQSSLKNPAKFVMFKKQFEVVLSSQNLIEIEKIKVNVRGGKIVEMVKNIINTNDYRCFPIIQEDLLEDGWEYPENYKNSKFKTGYYRGNKWGGKYLRAPQIYYTLLEKGKDKLIELGKIGNITRGFTTGINEFFYLNEEHQMKWNIEKEFLKPIVKGPKECDSIFIDKKTLKFKAFICNKSKLELKETNALKYIKWGEKQRTKDGDLWCKVPTVSSRKKWYELPKLPNADILFNQFYNERFLFPWNKDYYLVDHAFYYIVYPKNTKILVLILNSSFNFLMVEIYGRTGLGGGALQTYAPEMKPLVTINPLELKVDPKLIDEILYKYSKNKSKSIFEELGIEINKPIRDQEPKPISVRAELDNIIFDVLGLTKEEIKEIYLSICELVKQRIDKASSLKNEK